MDKEENVHLQGRRMSHNNKRYIPEDRALKNYSCKNLKFYKKIFRPQDGWNKQFRVVHNEERVIQTGHIVSSEYLHLGSYDGLYMWPEWMT
jgi:hypothetical protein